MSSKEFEAIEIYKSRQNLLAIQKERGMDITDYYNMSMEVIHALRRNDQLDMLLSSPQTGRKVYIKYYLKKNLRGGNIDSFIEDLFEYENMLAKEDDLIVVAKDAPNPSLKAAMQAVWEKKGIYVTVLDIKSLQFNILEHSLVPEHQVLSQEEKAAVFARYKISAAEQLPEISRFDPVAMVLCMRPGEVCRVNRGSKTALFSTAYRYCTS